VKAAPEFLDAKSAARFLGVQLRTLYSYASRGLLRSEPRAGSRGRQYAREDLQRLKSRHDARAGHAPVAASAMRFGEPVLETAISGIGPEGPLYRGRSAMALAREGRSFEAVCELLWTGELPETASWDPADAERALLRLRGTSARPHLRFLLARVAALAELAPSTETDGEWRLSRALVRVLAALTAGDGARARKAVRAPTVATSLATALGASSERTRALEFALIATADHELNASAFAARIVASTGAGLHACVAGALAALTGPKHGGSTERVEAFLDVRSPARAVRERSARGESVPGFSHPLYPDGDPRAVALLEVASSIAGSGAALRSCRAVVAAMEEQGRDRPNLDFALVALSRALGLPPGSAALVFAVGRTAGWIAHALEQRAADYLLRPRARYVGPGSVGLTKPA
jgi:citrate synthase